MAQILSSATLLCVLVSLFARGAQAESLLLEDYIDQVRRGHLGYQASREASDAARLRSSEAGLLRHPQLSFESKVSADAQPQFSGFSPESTWARSWRLSLNQELFWGVQSTLGYQLSNVRLSVGSTPLPVFDYTDYYDAIPSISVEIPLMRGAFGIEAQAERRVLESSFLFTRYSEDFRARTVLVDAELSYWRLAFVREGVSIYKKALDRCRLLEEWTLHRLRNFLSDTSDLLQARASTKIQELELQRWKDDEREAIQRFNQLRGKEGAADAEEVEPLTRAVVGDPPGLARNRGRSGESWVERADLLAADQAARLAEARANQAGESNRPRLNLFGSLSLNGRGFSEGEAIRRGWDWDRKTSVIGLMWVGTLDFWNRQEALAGTRRERESARLQYERKRFETRAEFLDLQRKWIEALSRLKLAKALLALQGDKVERERLKLKKGRSTTFQVIEFEGDAAAAQITQIQALWEVISTRAQLRTFEPDLKCGLQRCF